MHVMPLVDVMDAVPISTFLGGTGMQDVIDHMNETWRNGAGVIFGEGVFGDRYRAFREMVTDRQREIINAVEKTVQSVTCPDKFQYISSQEDLEHVPPCMYIPLLTYGPVRKLYDEGMIRGWGVACTELPDEDVCGRLINNGRFRSDDEEWMKDPESGVKYTVKTGDPDYTREELNKIESSRAFIDSWLEEQLGPGGDHLDMTDLPNQMGKLREATEEPEA